jgi:hypothetical protein
LDDYVGSVKDAPAEARTLRTEVAGIQSVLDNLGDFLNTIDETSVTFINGCVLSSAVDECNQNIKRLYMVFWKMAQAKKAGVLEIWSSVSDGH